MTLTENTKRTDRIRQHGFNEDNDDEWSRNYHLWTTQGDNLWYLLWLISALHHIHSHDCLTLFRRRPNRSVFLILFYPSSWMMLLIVLTGYILINSNCPKLAVKSARIVPFYFRSRDHLFVHRRSSPRQYFNQPRINELPVASDAGRSVDIGSNISKVKIINTQS